MGIWRVKSEGWPKAPEVVRALDEIPTVQPFLVFLSKCIPTSGAQEWQEKGATSAKVRCQLGPLGIA